MPRYKAANGGHAQQLALRQLLSRRFKFRCALVSQNSVARWLQPITGCR